MRSDRRPPSRAAQAIATIAVLSLGASLAAPASAQQSGGAGLETGTAQTAAPSGAPASGPARGAGPRQLAPWLSRALSGEGAETETVGPVAPPEAIVPTETAGAAGSQAGGQTGGQVGGPAGNPGATTLGASDPAGTGSGATGLASSGPASAGPGLAPGQAGPPIDTRPAPATAPAAVSVAPLDRVNASAAGVIPASEVGLPDDAWRGVSETQAVEKIEALKPSALHAANRLAVRLLSASLKPPAPGAGGGPTLLDARIEALSRFGAVETAARVLEAAGPDAVAASADVALISGRDGALCERLLATTTPSLPRIYCLAVDGQAAAAQLAIQATRDFAEGGAPDETTLSLLEAMTDKLFVEYVKAPQAAGELTPLRLAAMRRLSLSPPTEFARQAPLSLLPAALAPEFAPRLRLEALERLESAGALETRLLADAYRGTPSAESGGVWGRVEAYRRALGVGAATEGGVYAQAAKAAMIRAEEAGRGPTMARLLGRETARRAARQGKVSFAKLPREESLRRLLRLAGEHDAAALLLAAAGPQSVGPEERALDRLAAPGTPGVWNPNDAQALLARAARSDVEAGRLMAALNAFGFATPAPTLFPDPPNLAEDLAAGRRAYLAFHALGLLAPGEETQPEALYAALVTLTELGFEKEARHIAVETIILGR